MTQSQIEAITQKLQDTIRLLNTLLSESLALQEKERQQNEVKEIMLRKEAAINKKEALAKHLTSEAEVRAAALEEDRKKLIEEKHNLEHKDMEIDGRLKQLRAAEQQLEEKKAELTVLEEKSKELDEREKDLAKKLQDIAVREANIIKEITIDRERKDRLAAAEAEIKRKQAKLQRFLNE